MRRINNKYVMFEKGKNRVFRPKSSAQNHHDLLKDGPFPGMKSVKSLLRPENFSFRKAIYVRDHAIASISPL